MPFSTPTPVLVLPDTEKGRADQRRYQRQAEEADDTGSLVTIALCHEYKEDTNLNTQEYANLRGLDVAKVGTWEIRNVCVNRQATGDRRHQWCFRCPAGYMFWAPKQERHLQPGTDPDPVTRIRVN